jgi:hypothetical protein
MRLSNAMKTCCDSSHLCTLTHKRKRDFKNVTDVEKKHCEKNETETGFQYSNTAYIGGHSFQFVTLFILHISLP